MSIQNNRTTSDCTGQAVLPTHRITWLLHTRCQDKFCMLHIRLIITPQYVARESYRECWCCLCWCCAVAVCVLLCANGCGPVPLAGPPAECRQCCCGCVVLLLSCAALCNWVWASAVGRSPSGMQAVLVVVFCAVAVVCCSVQLGEGYCLRQVPQHYAGSVCVCVVCCCCRVLLCANGCGPVP
jgi:hypothetical protein